MSPDRAMRSSIGLGFRDSQQAQDPFHTIQEGAYTVTLTVTAANGYGTAQTITLGSVGCPPSHRLPTLRGTDGQPLARPRCRELHLEFPRRFLPGSGHRTHVHLRAHRKHHHGDCGRQPRLYPDRTATVTVSRSGGPATLDEIVCFDPERPFLAAPGSPATSGPMRMETSPGPRTPTGRREKETTSCPSWMATTAPDQWAGHCPGEPDRSPAILGPTTVCGTETDLHRVRLSRTTNGLSTVSSNRQPRASAFRNRGRRYSIELVVVDFTLPPRPPTPSSG